MRGTPDFVDRQTDISPITAILYFSDIMLYSKTCSYSKTNQMHKFLKFVFGIKLYMFRTVPLSTIRSFSLYTQQWYMSYRFAVCIVKNS